MVLGRSELKISQKWLSTSANIIDKAQRRWDRTQVTKQDGYHQITRKGSWVSFHARHKCFICCCSKGRWGGGCQRLKDQEVKVGELLEKLKACTIFKPVWWKVFQYFNPSCRLSQVYQLNICDCKSLIISGRICKKQGNCCFWGEGGGWQMGF